MISELLQSLQGFEPLALAIISPLVMIVGFGYLIKSGKIKFDIESKEDKEQCTPELLKSFQEATNAMKQMSNDNMHELTSGVLKVIDARFETIEKLIQNDVVFANKNLISGVRDEIKTSMNGWALTKLDFNNSVKKFENVVSKFERMCNRCKMLR